MNKLKEIKNKISDFVEENKKLTIGLFVGTFVFVLFLFNMNYLQISYYKMTQDTQKIANVLSKEIKEEKNHSKIHFRSGITYLMEDMSEVSQDFFEKYFSYLDTEAKDQVLKTYNEKGEFFKSQQVILEEVSKENKSESIKAYLNRLDMNTFELELVEYFGQNPKLTQDVVIRLHNIISMYDTKLTMEKFKISIYELMQFPLVQEEESIALKLLDNIEASTAHSMLFTELKTKEIDVDMLNAWVDVLNKKKIISTQQYAAFTNSYSGIKQLREEYTQLQRQEVDIKNIKQKIDVETEEFVNKIGKLTKEIETINADLSNKKLALSNLKTYKSVELYIMDYNEDGTYEAAIPEKSWFFGTYKPSNDKVKLKLTSSQPEAQGVYSFEVYYQGESEKGIPYYIEVSPQQREEIASIEKEIIGLRSTVEQKEAEILKLEAEVDKVRKANNYEQNNRLLEEVDHKRENILLKLKEKQIEIQTLFGIGNVTVEADKK